MLPAIVNVARGSSRRMLQSMRHNLARRHASNGNGSGQVGEAAESVHVTSRMSNVEQDIRYLQRNTDNKFERIRASMDKRFDHLEGSINSMAREARTTTRWLIGLGVGVALGVARLSLFPPAPQANNRDVEGTTIQSSPK